MSKMSLGVYNALDIGPGENIKEEDEIYLISGFTEIGTISKIGDLFNIIKQDDLFIRLMFSIGRFTLTTFSNSRRGKIGVTD